MIFIAALVGLIAPRVLIALLWFFSTWFNGVFETRGWPILGFLFLPLTLLWYSIVMNWYDGVWMWWHVVILVLAVMFDIDSPNKARKHR